MAKPRLGSGQRFKTLQSKIASRGNVRDPGAVAASIGRKKYGASRFAKLSAAGKRNPDPLIFTKGTLRNLTHEGVDEDLTEQRLAKKDGRAEAFETNPLPSTGFVAQGEPFAPGVRRNVGDPTNRGEAESVREPVAKAAGETFTPGTVNVVEKDTLDAGGFPEGTERGED